MVFVNESAPAPKKALHASVIAASSAAGSLLGVVAVIIVEAATTRGGRRAAPRALRAKEVGPAGSGVSLKWLSESRCAQQRRATRNRRR